MRSRAAIFASSLLLIASAAAPVQGQARRPVPATKPAELVFVVSPTGNEARYRVREQLVGFDLPNDAVGITKNVTGRIVVGRDGRIVRDSSRIVVQVTSLKSDKTRRDGFLQKNTLETSKYPQVELVPTTFEGLTEGIPPGSTTTFSLVGDLTVRGVTHPTTWHVTARADGSDVVGSAATVFTFKDFGLDQPRVPVLLSVADTIKLEYDFRFSPEANP
ncbi:MAG TPA: YceI family protein [Gemmatimonadaceae bacterium]|nr:YceI family protein [Gemmatimonadaceae bacterium]